MGGVRCAVLAGQRSWLLDRIRQKPDLTLHALRAELAERGTIVSVRAVWKVFTSVGIRFKKSLLPAEQLPTRIAQPRERWQSLQRHLGPSRPVLFDESWAKTNLVALHGRAPRGQRLHE